MDFSKQNKVISEADIRLRKTNGKYKHRPSYEIGEGVQAQVNEWEDPNGDVGYTIIYRTELDGVRYYSNDGETWNKLEL